MGSSLQLEGLELEARQIIHETFPEQSNSNVETRTFTAQFRCVLDTNIKSLVRDEAKRLHVIPIAPFRNISNPNNATLI